MKSPFLTNSAKNFSTDNKQIYVFILTSMIFIDSDWFQSVQQNVKIQIKIRSVWNQTYCKC